MAEICNPHVPDDLHPLILRNLNSKPLVKFMITSKSWSALIKSPYFISLHRNQQQKSNNNNPQFLLKSHKGFFIFRYGDPVGRRRHRLQSPSVGFDTVVASSSTLICLSSVKDENTLLVWNPSINRFKKIVSCSYDKSNFALGVTDYKIVMIGYNSNEYDSLGLGEFGLTTLIPPYAKVYCVDNKPSLGWKHIPMPIPLLYDDDGRRLSRISKSGCTVKGLIHWIVFRYHFDFDVDVDVDYEFGFEFRERGDCILTFDPKRDSFEAMHLPAPLTEVDDPDLSLAVVDDCLAVIHHSGTEQGIIRVWRMEEEYDSWNMSYKITLAYDVTNSKFWGHEKGKRFITTCSGKLIAFNLNTGVGHVGMTGGQAFDFTQSLLLLE